MKLINFILIVSVAMLLTACITTSLEGKSILFYGNTCPHCAQLEEDIKEFRVEEKFQFERKEVYDNKANANLLSVAAGNCGLNPNRVGVPFLYAENKCFIGVPDIEKYISEKTGISFEATNSASANESTPSSTPSVSQ